MSGDHERSHLSELDLRVRALESLLVEKGLVDPAALTGGGQVQQTDYQPTPEEQERFEFVRVVLADTEDVWGREFERIGKRIVFAFDDAACREVGTGRELRRDHEVEAAEPVVRHGDEVSDLVASETDGQRHALVDEGE